MLSSPMRLPWIALACVACGRIGFDATSTAGDGATEDGVGLGDGPLVAGLVGWWACDDDPSNGLANSAGIDTGTCQPTRCPHSAPGMRAGGCEFDGADDVVAIAGVRLQSPSFTVALWLRFASTATISAVVDKRHAGGLSSWRLFSSFATIPLQYYTFDGTTETPCFQTGFAQRDTWYHVALAFEGNQMSLYVDGALDRSCATSGPVALDDAQLEIGDSSTSSFAGIVDELRIYDRALSAGEVAALPGL